MENIVMERSFAPAIDQPAFYDLARQSAGCLELYRANWCESLLARDGGTLVCRFEAPDAESIRLLSRGDASRDKRVWAGSLHGAGGGGLADVVVERRFTEPASMAELQAREDAAAWCLQEHRVSFLRSFFSADRRRMLCLYQAPDAESVRLAQQQAQMPVARVWACCHYTPANIFQ